MNPGINRVEIIGQDDQQFIIHGQGAGDRGIYLGESPDGLWYTPEKQTWTSGARAIGAKQKNRKILARDMDLPLMVKETTSHTYEENESYLVQAVGFELDPWDDDAKYAKLAITTDLSGTRFVDMVQYEEPGYEPDHDPIMNQYADITMKLRVGDADWYGDTVVEHAYFTDNGEQEIWIENPCPRPMLHFWVVTPGKWLIPDFSWRGKRGHRRPGGDDENRYVTVEVEDVDGVTTIRPADRSQLMIENEHETNILGRQTSRGFFLYEIPPYTPRQALTVYLEDCPDDGAKVELHQPRRWFSPWGGELQ